MQEVAPRIVETEDGHQLWEFDGQRFTQVGMNAMAGRRPETMDREPAAPGGPDLETFAVTLDNGQVFINLAGYR